MTVTQLARGLAPLFAALTLAACGADAADPASSTGSALTLDPPDAAALTPVPPSEFACGTVACDAATQYCRHTVGGVHPMPGHPATGTYTCLPLPEQCASNPSCACLAPNAIGPGPRACSAGASGGLTVTLLVP